MDENKSKINIVVKKNTITMFIHESCKEDSCEEKDCSCRSFCNNIEFNFIDNNIKDAEVSFNGGTQNIYVKTVDESIKKFIELYPEFSNIETNNYKISNIMENVHIKMILNKQHIVEKIQPSIIDFVVNKNKILDTEVTFDGGNTYIPIEIICIVIKKFIELHPEFAISG